MYSSLGITTLAEERAEGVVGQLRVTLAIRVDKGVCGASVCGEAIDP